MGKRTHLFRLSLYPLNFICTYSLMMVAYAKPRLYKPSIFFFVSDAMESLNGFLNVAVYYAQSRYVVRLLGTPDVLLRIPIQPRNPTDPQPATQQLGSLRQTNEGEGRREV